MVEAVFMLMGIFGGAFLGRFMFGRRGGNGTTGTKETCVYFCTDGTKKKKTCDSGDSGTCLEDLIDECPGNV